MLTERQLRGMHKAGVEVKVSKRSVDRDWIAYTHLHAETGKVVVTVCPHKNCCRVCGEITLLHELIHARDALSDRIMWTKEDDRKLTSDIGGLKNHEDRVDLEAIRTYAKNPEIFKLVEELFGVKWELLK